MTWHCSTRSQWRCVSETKQSGPNLHEDRSKQTVAVSGRLAMAGSLTQCYALSVQEFCAQVLEPVVQVRRASSTAMNFCMGYPKSWHLIDLTTRWGCLEDRQEQMSWWPTWASWEVILQSKKQDQHGLGLLWATCRQLDDLTRWDRIEELHIHISVGCHCMSSKLLFTCIA